MDINLVGRGFFAGIALADSSILIANWLESEFWSGAERPETPFLE
jgi:hypothetical protein